MKPSEILRAASKLPRTDKHLARDGFGIGTDPIGTEAACWCALGAMLKVCQPHIYRLPAMNYFRSAAPKRLGVNPPAAYINDNATAEELEATWQRAITLAEEAETIWAKPVHFQKGASEEDGLVYMGAPVGT